MRRAIADGIEVVDGEGDIELACDGEQVENRIRRTTRRAGGDVGVLDSLASDDLGRTKVILSDLQKFGLN